MKNLSLCVPSSLFFLVCAATCHAADPVAPTVADDRARLIQQAKEKVRPEFFADTNSLLQNSVYGKALTDLQLPVNPTEIQTREYLHRLYGIIESHPEVSSAVKYPLVLAKLRNIPAGQIELLLQAASEGHYVPYELVDSKITEETVALLWKYLLPGVVFYNQESSVAFQEGNSWDLYPPNILDLILTRNLHKGHEPEILNAFVRYFSVADREARIASFKDVRYLQAMGRLGLYPPLGLSQELLQKGCIRDFIFAYLYGPQCPYPRNDLLSWIFKQESERCKDSAISYWRDELLTDLVLEGDPASLRWLLNAEPKDAKGGPRFRLIWALDKENNCLYVSRNRQLSLGGGEQRAGIEQKRIAEHLWFERIKINDSFITGLTPRGNVSIEPGDLFYSQEARARTSVEVSQWLEQNAGKVRYLSLLHWSQPASPTVRAAFEDIGVFYINETPAWHDSREKLAAISSQDPGTRLEEMAKILVSEKRNIPNFSVSGIDSEARLLWLGRRSLLLASLTEAVRAVGNDPKAISHFLSALYREGKGNLPGNNALQPEDLFAGKIGPEHTQLSADYFPVEPSLQLVDLRPYLPGWRRRLAPAVGAGLKYVPSEKLMEWHIRTAAASEVAQHELMRLFYEGWRYQAKSSSLHLMPLDFAELILPRHASEFRRLVADVILASPYPNKPSELIEECRHIQDDTPAADKGWTMHEWKDEHDFNWLVQIAAATGYQSALKIVCEQLKHYPSQSYSLEEAVPIANISIAGTETRRELYQRIEKLITENHLPTKFDYSQLPEDYLNYKGFPAGSPAFGLGAQTTVDLLAMASSKDYRLQYITKENILVVHTPGLITLYPFDSPEYRSIRFVHVGSQPFLDLISSQIVGLPPGLTNFESPADRNDSLRQWLEQNYSKLSWDESLQKYKWP